MEDVYNPLELYRSSLKDLHARNTSDYFEALLADSGVDEELNTKTVRELRDLEKQVEEADKNDTLWKLGRGLAIVTVLVFLYLTYAQHWAWLIGSLGTTAIIVVKLNPIIKAIEERLEKLRGERDAKEHEARAQMEPLNRLYHWRTFAQLVQKTVPRLEVDPFFTGGRLDQLRNSYGWDDSYNEPRSVVFAHSGLVNGNPFVFAHTLNHWIGNKTYHGTLQISWTESVRDSNGKWRSVRRNQTLRASVTKPFPEYGDELVLIYGNQAAPDLSFSRTPSSLSALEDGVISKWRKGLAIKKLEAKSRKITEGKSFTVMANREFDALFGATDRDNEVQFRLLFTPLAQQEMVKLLKDKDVGYGDEFSFIKSKMINLVEPGRASEKDISADPKLFHAYEVAYARNIFNDYHNELFKSFFFSMAPLLTIPLYQQHRTHEDIYKDVLKQPSCFWEHESIANYMGEANFRHPDCLTRSILKAQPRRKVEDAQEVDVTAHGYRGINRVDYVSVRGGDGHNHRVPVEWIEYVEVSQRSKILVYDQFEGENAEAESVSSTAWQARFKARGIEPEHTVLRRSIVTGIL
jgi:hypothetical protein